MTQSRDDVLWRELRDCEERRFDAVNRFLNSSENPDAILRQALLGDMWDRISALRLLRESRDNERLIAAVPVLLDLATGMHGLLELVREVIARVPREWMNTHFMHLVLERLAREDYSGYRRLAELLVFLGRYELLGELVNVALASEDPDIREVGEDFRGGSSTDESPD